MYNGLKIVTVTEQELADFYSGRLRYELLLNQYLILENENGDIVDKWKNDKGEIKRVQFKAFDSKLLGKIKPRNIRQELLIDLLNSKALVLSVSGIAGGGKTFCTTAHALQELDKGTYKKIILIRNNIPVANVPDLGILPGDVTEKLKASCAFMGDIISDFYFDSFIEQNKIEIVPLSTMRSRSLSDSYILVNEAQNLTTELVKMILTRVGEKSRIVFDFDLSQIDKRSFEKDNGMLSMNESLKGHELFGAVELDLIERSDVARLASLIK